MRPSDRTTRFAAAAVACALLWASPAVADEYDQDQAGHPLRIAAYVLHPIGWFLDYFVFEPFHKIGNSPPGRVIFGHRDDFREVASETGAAEPPAEPAPAGEDSEI